ncbi:MAG: PQQ-binding-like beta-propeller repeat protein [Thermoplasmata archaeon]
MTRMKIFTMSIAVLMIVSSIGIVFGSTTEIEENMDILHENNEETKNQEQNILLDPVNPTVKMNTTNGTIRIKLFGEDAPITVENFLKYVDDGFYDGLIFHRVVEDFIIQSGGYYPNMTKKDPTYPPIENEAAESGHRNYRGTLAMARTSDPDSATSQFYINHADNSGFLDWDTASDGYGYCVFGEVVEGMDVVDEIASVKTQSEAGHNDVPVVDILIHSISIDTGLADSPWPMFGHDLRHTGQSQYDTSHVDGYEKWNFSTGSWIYPSPAIGHDGTLYVGSNDGYFYALNTNGTEKWRFNTNFNVTSSAAIAKDGTIYIPSSSKLYAIYPNGTEKWNYSTSDYIDMDPAIDENGTIYIGSDHDKLYAIYPNGTEKWNYTPGSGVSSPPAVDDNGTIYIGSHDDYLYAINPNRTVRWKYYLGSSNFSFCAPTIDENGTIYVSSEDLVVLNNNGSKKWNFNIQSYLVSSAAISTDGTIYFCSADGKLYSVDKFGIEEWNFTTGDRPTLQPAIGKEGTIHIGSQDNSIYAVHPNGTKKWDFPTGDIIRSSPAIGMDGTVYIGSNDQKLYALGQTPPSITSTQPSPDETNVPVNQQVTVTFSKSMNTSHTPTLEQTVGPVVGYNFAGWSNTSVENDTAIWTHDSWQTNSSISLRVSDYYDVNGNMGSDHSWNFTTSLNIDISNNSKWQINPSIWGDLVVWEDYRNDSHGSWSSPGLRNADIYMYNISSGDLTPLVTDTDDQRTPAIWENYVVWEDYRNGNADIYYVDLTDPSLTQHQLTSDNSDQVEPAIHDGKIVWTDYRDDSDGEIYMYDLKEEETYVIYSDGKLSQPDIYGDRIVWTRSEGFPARGDILLYDLTVDDDEDGIPNYKDSDTTSTANSTTNLNNDSVNQKNPSIYKDIIAWTEYKSGDNDVKYLKLGDKIHTVSNNGSEEEYPKIFGYRLPYMEKHYESGNHTYDAVWFYDMISNKTRLISKIKHEPWHPTGTFVRSVDIHSNNLAWEEKHNSTDPNLTYQYSIYLRSLDKKPPNIENSSVSSDGIEYGDSATMDLLPNSTLEFRANVTDIDDDLEEVYVNVSSLNLTTDKIMMNEMKMGVYNCTLHYDPSLSEGSRNVSIYARDEDGNSATGRTLNLTFSAEHVPVIEEALVGNSTDNLDVEAHFSLEPGNQLFFRVLATDEDGDLSSVRVNTSDLNTTQDEYPLTQDGTDPDVYRLTLDYQDPMTPGEKTIIVYAVDEKSHMDSAELTVHAETPFYDTFPPSVERVLPKDGAQGITLDRNVKVIFNETMDTNSEPNIENLNDLTEDWNFQGWETTNVAYDTAVWSHDKWENDDEISVRLWNYYDSNSNQGSTHTWSFTTMAGPEFDYVRHSSVTNRSARLTVRFTLGNYSSVNVSFNYRRVGTTAWYNTDSVEYTSTSIHQEDISELSPNSTYEFTALIDYKDGTEFSDSNTFDTEEEETVHDDEEQEEGFGVWIPLLIIVIIALVLLILFLLWKRTREEEPAAVEEPGSKEELEVEEEEFDEEPEGAEESRDEVEGEVDEFDDEPEDKEEELLEEFEEEPEDAEVELDDEISEL